MELNKGITSFVRPIVQFKLAYLKTVQLLRQNKYVEHSYNQTYKLQFKKDFFLIKIFNSAFAFSALTLLVGRQEGHDPAY